MSRIQRPGQGSLLRRLRSPLAACAILAAAVNAFPAPYSWAASPVHAPATAPSQVTFGIGPASATKIDGRPVLNYLVSPGARLLDHVGLINIGLRPVTLNLYAVDAVNGSGGDIGYQPRSAPRLGASNWFAFETANHASTVTLPPRSTRIVTVAVTVPGNAEPGDHVAGVIASVISQVTSKSGEKVNFEQRVALRAYFRVSGLIKPQLSVQGLHARYHGTLNPFGSGRTTINYTVRNTGNVDLGGLQSVKITGLFGIGGSLHTQVNIPLLLPGGSFPVRVGVGGVWPEFFMQAHVRVTPVAPVGAADPSLAAHSTTTSFWAVPWTLLGVVVVLLVLLVAWRLWGARRRGSTGTHRPPPTGGVRREVLTRS